MLHIFNNPQKLKIMDYRVNSANFFANNDGEGSTIGLSLRREDGVDMKNLLFLSSTLIENAFNQRRLNLDDYTENDLLYILENATLQGSIKNKKKGETFKVTREGQTVFDSKGNRREASNDDIGKEFKVAYDGLWIDYEALPFGIKFDRKVIKEIEFEKLEKQTMLAKIAKD